MNAIHEEAGRLLAPTKIAATALRIANASKDQRPSYYVPGVTEFAEQMDESPPSEVRRKLDFLIPASADRQQYKTSPFCRSFVKVKSLLSYSSCGGAFWIPDPLLADLPAGVWQVLIFWAYRVLTSSEALIDLEASREEVIRFALFWHLFVWNDDKATSWCFEYLKSMKNDRFPGKLLYQLINGTERDDRCASAVISAEEFSNHLPKGEDRKWRTDGQRFGEGASRNDVVAHWWWHGRKLLPWFQRDYVRRAFPGYRPLTNHEEDLPYDIDHICPYNDWREDWRTLQRRLDMVDKDIQDAMYNGRDAVGNGIGNLRLVESSTNRREQDDDLAVKMPFIQCAEPIDICDERAMTDWAFAPEHRDVWSRVSRVGSVRDRQWDGDRLAAFQRAVEHRTAWLYRCFHDHLGYGAWTGGLNPE